MTHRFINADSYPSTDTTDPIGCNMFAYCGNNPVSRADDGGEFWHIVIGAAVGATIGFVSSVVSDLLSGEEVDWWGAAISAGIGAVEGGLTAACPAYAVVISATASAADTAINSTRNYVNKGEGSVGGIVAKTVVSAGIGALSGNGDDLVKHFKSYGAGASRRIGRVIVRGYKSVLTEGTSAVRGGLTAIAKEIAGSGKYYFSQTKFFYKKNFWKSDLLSFLDDTLNGTIDNYLTREIA